MSTKKNIEYLKMVQEYQKNLELAKKLTVAVGLPQEEVGGEVYGNGKTVTEIGAIHEFGSPEQSIPSRSFLRVPFRKNEKDLSEFTNKQFRDILEKGADAKSALEKVGIKFLSIVQLYFKSEGDGSWGAKIVDVWEDGKKVKKNRGSLVDTGTLRQSLSYAVREGK